MPRIKSKKKDYMLTDFNVWVAGQLHIREMKQSELGDLLGIPQQSVSQRLRGQTPWTLKEAIIVLHEFQADEKKVSQLLIYD